MREPQPIVIRYQDARLLGLEQRGLDVELRPEGGLEDLGARARERGRRRGDDPRGRARADPRGRAAGHAASAARGADRRARAGPGPGPSRPRSRAQRTDCRPTPPRARTSIGRESLRRSRDWMSWCRAASDSGPRTRCSTRSGGSARTRSNGRLGSAHRTMRDHDPHPRRQPPGDELEGAPATRDPSTARRRSRSRADHGDSGSSPRSGARWPSFAGPRARPPPVAASATSRACRCGGGNSSLHLVEDPADEVA